MSEKVISSPRNKTRSLELKAASRKDIAHALALRLPVRPAGLGSRSISQN